MKKFISFSVTFLIFTIHIFAQSNNFHRKINVLFIGNSYTYVNDLPSMIDSLAIAGGDTILHSQYTPGGYSFYDHSNDANTINIIHQQQWDYVVLQEQSQNPSLDSAYVDANVIPYLLFLDSVIRLNNPCTKVVMYETWGREYGDSQNCGVYPPVCTYDGMQQRLKESYMLMADTVKGIVAPVGEAFRAMRLFDSTVVLYQSDQSHPSPEGTYLAACVFHHVFFHDNTLGNTFHNGFTQQLAINLQSIGMHAVTDSMKLWNIEEYEPWAEFSDQLAGLGLEAFYSESDSSFSHYWDFGDSTTSTQANPVHQYTYPHYFPVKHVVCDSCRCDTFYSVVNIVNVANDVDEINYSDEIGVFPNPSSDIFYLKSDQPLSATINIYNPFGENVYRDIFRGSFIKIDLAGYTQGIYFAIIQSDKKRYVLRLSKE